MEVFFFAKYNKNYIHTKTFACWPIVPTWCKHRVKWFKNHFFETNNRNFGRLFIKRFRKKWYLRSDIELNFKQLSTRNWPNSQIPECTCSISHNATSRTEMCTFLFWMLHCGIWNRCILGFVKLVYYLINGSLCALLSVPPPNITKSRSS